MSLDGAQDGASRPCRRCGAALPAGRESALCALCASGLGPAAEYQPPPPENAAGPASAEPDSDSGLRCPHCRSRLSYRDVGRQLCPVCGAGVGLDSMFGPSGGLGAQAGGSTAAGDNAPGSGLRFTAPLDTYSPDDPDWDMHLPIW